MRRWLPCTHRALNRAVRQVVGMAQACGCLEGRQADLEIATREALANAMIHGNADSHHKRVFLRCYGEPDAGILLAIRDEGNGFDPEQVPDPRRPDRKHLDHGRGLFLMRQLMDRVEYRKGGREVLLYKACSDPEQR